MEDRERPVCTACGYVDYVNPINVVGTVPTWDDGRQVLLCLRNIEPRRGYWTLPAGFLEYGETLVDGAARETREESGASIDIDGIYTVFDVVHAGQVHVFYRARLRSLDMHPGLETIEQRLFGLDEIPWDDLAFPTVRTTLEHYVVDHGRGSFDTVHTASITWPRRPGPAADQARPNTSTE